MANQSDATGRRSHAGCNPARFPQAAAPCDDDSPDGDAGFVAGHPVDSRRFGDSQAFCGRDHRWITYCDTADLDHASRPLSHITEE